jgi:hypothetical protein
VPAETFTDVVELLEDPDPERYDRPRNLDIRQMYWSEDATPFWVKVRGEDRLRRVLSVVREDDQIVVEIE